MREPRIQVPLNDLSRAWIATSAEVKAAVIRVTESGYYIQGPEHEAFERELAAFLGVQSAMGVASGTDALSLALLSVGCHAGSEIVAAANAGGYATVAAVRLGCGVTYADVDPSSLLLTAETVAEAIGPTTRAVVVTHLYGNVADVASIVALCKPLGIAVVEDCAQSFGATVNGRRVGTLADVAALSFYPTKPLGAAGDGGAVITDDSSIAAMVRSLRQYGWSTKYVVDLAQGMNSRLDEMQSAILRLGLGRVDALNSKRQDIVRRYRDAVMGTGVSVVSGATHSFVGHLAVLRFDDRDHARSMLDASGVATDIHYPVPDHWQAGFPRPLRPTDLSQTERAVGEIVTVPCFAEMTNDEIETVCETLSAVART